MDNEHLIKVAKLHAELGAKIFAASLVYPPTKQTTLHETQVFVKNHIKEQLDVTVKLIKKNRRRVIQSDDEEDEEVKKPLIL